MIKISIITVCYNSEKTIEDAINSVYLQDYKNIEYIIIDGESSDSTNSIILKNIDKIDKYISEKDNGLYDAINKGIFYSTGDIIGILNSDDTFANSNIVSSIASYFSNNNLDVLFADIAFVNSKYQLKSFYSSKYWNPSLLKFGFMPAHPTFYCKKNLFNKYGFYSLDYKIAADFELIVRFFKNENKINFLYIPRIFVFMKLGGLSTRGIKSKFIILREIMKACKANKLKTNYFFLLIKYIFKFFIYSYQSLFSFLSKNNRIIIDKFY